MAELKAPYKRSFEVPASPREVFEVLADVPNSASHFPDLVSFEAKGGGYAWRLEKSGMKPYYVEMAYACVYVSDPEAMTVEWTPIQGAGNSRVTGRWTIEPSGAGTRFAIVNEAVLTMDLPRALRGVGQTLMASENKRRMDTYLANLCETFCGGDGRISAEVTGYGG